MGSVALAAAEANVGRLASILLSVLKYGAIHEMVLGYYRLTRRAILDNHQILSAGVRPGNRSVRSVVQPPFHLISKVLKQRLVGDASLIEQLFPNTTHCAVVTPAFHAGLLAVMGLPIAPKTTIATIGPD